MTYLLALFLMLSTPPTARGFLTQFGGPTDRHLGGNALCTGKRVQHSTWGIATRWGKCGDLFILRNPKNGRWVIAPRIDAGPWRAIPRWCLRGRRNRFRTTMKCRRHYGVTMVRLRRGHTYARNVADATRTVMRALGHRGGVGAVQMWRLR